MNKYLIKINTLLANSSLPLPPHEVFKELLIEYCHVEPSRSLFNDLFPRHHVLIANRIKTLLAQNAAKKNPTYESFETIIAQQLNSIPVYRIKRNGDFHELLKAFLSVYPHYISELETQLVQHIQPVKHLFYPAKIIKDCLARIELGPYILNINATLSRWQSGRWAAESACEKLSSLVTYMTEMDIEKALICLFTLLCAETNRNYLRNSRHEIQKTIYKLAEHTPSVSIRKVLEIFQSKIHDSNYHDTQDWALPLLKLALLHKVPLQSHIVNFLFEALPVHKQKELTPEENDLYAKFHALYSPYSPRERLGEHHDNIIIQPPPVFFGAPDLYSKYIEIANFVCDMQMLTDNSLSEIKADIILYLDEPSIRAKLMACYVIASRPHLFSETDKYTVMGILEEQIDRDAQDFNVRRIVEDDFLRHIIPALRIDTEAVMKKKIVKYYLERKYFVGLLAYAPFDDELKTRITSKILASSSANDYGLSIQSSLVLKAHLHPDFTLQVVRHYLDSLSAGHYLSSKILEKLLFDATDEEQRSVIEVLLAKFPVTNDKYYAIDKLLIKISDTLEISSKLFLIDNLVTRLSTEQSDELTFRILCILNAYASEPGFDANIKNKIISPYLQKLTAKGDLFENAKLAEISNLIPKQLKFGLCLHAFKKLESNSKSANAIALLGALAQKMDCKMEDFMLMPFFTLACYKHIGVEEMNIKTATAFHRMYQNNEILPIVNSHFGSNNDLGVNVIEYLGLR
jgi:hypothetical protein